MGAIRGDGHHRQRHRLRVRAHAALRSPPRRAVCRIILGLGTGTKRMQQDWHGLDGEHPASRMEELVPLLRRLLRLHEGPIEHDGRFYRLVVRPTAPVAPPLRADLPIYMAGVNPRMVEAAGAVSDGLVGHPLFTREYVAEVVRPALVRGAERAGSRRAGPLAYARRRRRARGRAPVSVPELAEARSTWRGRLTDAVSDRMLDTIALVGTPREVREQFHERRAGVFERTLLWPPATGGFAAAEALIEAFRALGDRGGLALGPRGLGGRAGARRSGRRGPGRALQATVPPWDSATARTIASPRPEEPARSPPPRTKRSNIRGAGELGRHAGAVVLDDELDLAVALARPAARTSRARRRVADRVLDQVRPPGGGARRARRPRSPGSASTVSSCPSETGSSSAAASATTAARSVGRCGRHAARRRRARAAAGRRPAGACAASERSADSAASPCSPSSSSAAARGWRARWSAACAARARRRRRTRAGARACPRSRRARRRARASIPSSVRASSATSSSASGWGTRRPRGRACARSRGPRWSARRSGASRAASHRPGRPAAPARRRPSTPKSEEQPHARDRAVDVRGQRPRVLDDRALARQRDRGSGATPRGSRARLRRSSAAGTPRFGRALGLADARGR